MRLSIRAKQIAGVTAIVGVTVVALSGLYLTRLAAIIVTESHARAQVLASTILHRVTQLTIDPTDKYAALRADEGLRSILEASVGALAASHASRSSGATSISRSAPSMTSWNTGAAT